MATHTMLNQLPKLDDDGDKGLIKEHIVPRDDEADLKFVGTLLASVAPRFEDAVSKERWIEHRIHSTKSGKYVFSTVGRSARQGERDKFDAEVWDAENPPTEDVDWEEDQDGKRIVAGVRMVSWYQAAIKFFGYSDLAKRLYREVGIEFEERID